MPRTSVSPQPMSPVLIDFLLALACYAGVTRLFLGSSAVLYLLYEGGLSACVFAALTLMVCMYFQGVYGPRHRSAGFDLIPPVCTAMGFTFLVQAVAFYFNRGIALPLFVMLAGTGVIFAALFGWRLLFYGSSSGGLGREHVLLVGATEMNRAIGRRIEAVPEFGFAVAGYVDDEMEPGMVLEGGKVLGPLSSLREIRATVKHHRIVTDLPHEEMALTLAGDMAAFPGAMERPDSLYELLFGRVCHAYLRPSTMLFGELQPARLNIAAQAAYTNVAALLVLLAAAPLLLLVAAAIKLTSPGPVCEAQSTMGWQLTPFTLFRFRCHAIRKTAAGEHRELTAVGRWLRRLRLDGLPQLVNILRGEMALTGPPPVREEFAALLLDMLPYYRMRFVVKPGVTGWSQIHPDAGDAIGQLEYDLYYIKYLSLALDMSILLHGFRGRAHRLEPAAEMTL